MIRSPGRRGRLLVALVVLPLVFAACSASAGTDAGVASLASPGAAAASASPGASTNPEDAMLDFAQCMRDNGVDMPDPQSGGRGVTIVGGPGSGIDPQSEEFQAAMTACQDLQPAFGPGGGDGPATSSESPAP
jgi:hypothetical protein